MPALRATAMILKRCLAMPKPSSPRGSSSSSRNCQPTQHHANKVAGRRSIGLDPDQQYGVELPGSTLFKMCSDPPCQTCCGKSTKMRQVSASPPAGMLRFSAKVDKARLHNLVLLVWSHGVATVWPPPDSKSTRKGILEQDPQIVVVVDHKCRLAFRRGATRARITPTAWAAHVPVRPAGPTGSSATSLHARSCAHATCLRGRLRLPAERT